MDLSELTVEDTPPLNTVELPELWIQAKMEGVDKENPYTFYVDGIQLYPVRQP